MKRLLIIFLILILISGCVKKNDVYLEYLDSDYKLVPKFKKECINESKEYFKYINKNFYLVCIDDIFLEEDNSNSLDLENLKDYFDLLDSHNIINVFITNNASESDVVAIKNKIDNYDNVFSTTIKSKEQWKDEISQESDALSSIINKLDENPLSDSLIVKAKSLEFINNIAQNIEKIPMVDDVRYSKLLITQNDDFIDNLVTHNKTKIKEINQGILYKFNNLSLITCKDNIYIGPKNFKYYDNYCK